MEAYTSFAQVYDLFMDNVPYEKWCEWMTDYLKKEGIEDGLLLDLGCGTGKLTRLMAEKGYDMIGVDMSYEMLEIARDIEMERVYGGEDAFDQTFEENGESFDEEELVSSGKKPILYLEQDMREFELYGTVRAIYSACDCMNYLLEEDDIYTVLCLASNYLDPGGLFIFDINTKYKYEKLLANNTFAETREESSFIWNNFYDEDKEINEYDLTIFCKEEDGRFARFEEQHYQRCYEIETIKEMIEEAGLALVGVYDAYSNEEAREDSEKVTFVCRELHHEGKFYTE